MTVIRFLESLITPYENTNIIFYDEHERVIAEYSFANHSENISSMFRDLNNNFGDCEIFNFYAEPHWSYNKTYTMIYHLFV